MTTREGGMVSKKEYLALSSFRSALARFLRFSERTARTVGIAAAACVRLRRTRLVVGRRDRGAAACQRSRDDRIDRALPRGRLGAQAPPRRRCPSRRGAPDAPWPPHARSRRSAQPRGAAVAARDLPGCPCQLKPSARPGRGRSLSPPPLMARISRCSARAGGAAPAVPQRRPVPPISDLRSTAAVSTLRAHALCQ